MSKLRYFDANGQKKLPAATAHSEFLRTGRIIRKKENWLPEERRYMTHEEVAERTIRRLDQAAERTHEHINGFHTSMSFPKMIYSRALASRPHLGYCHVTAAKTKFAEYDEIGWAFFIANFFSEIGEDSKFMDRVNLNYSRMYFAIAMQPDTEQKKMAINNAIRGNGVLFRTHDPKIAFKNVLMLRTRNEKLRDFIRKM